MSKPAAFMTTWADTRYGKEHRSMGRHYRIYEAAFTEAHPEIDMLAADVSDVINAIRNDLVRHYKEAIVSSFARHCTFVYDALRIASKAYENKDKEKSAWDITKDMYYSLDKSYDCYSFEVKITLAKPNANLVKLDYWPAYVESDHAMLASAFNRLPYVKKCECEVNSNPNVKSEACEIYCVNKHSNITSRFLSTASLFPAEKNIGFYNELTSMNPEVTGKVMERIPNDGDRAIHLQAVYSGNILERLDEKAFAALSIRQDLVQFKNIIRHIGKPELSDLARIIPTEGAPDTVEIPVVGPDDITDREQAEHYYG